jgi:hypothetical protein
LFDYTKGILADRRSAALRWIKIGARRWQRDAHLDANQFLRPV